MLFSVLKGLSTTKSIDFKRLQVKLNGCCSTRDLVIYLQTERIKGKANHDRCNMNFSKTNGNIQQKQ